MFILSFDNKKKIMNKLFKTLVGVFNPAICFLVFQSNGLLNEFKEVVAKSQPNTNSIPRSGEFPLCVECFE